MQKMNFYVFEQIPKFAPEKYWAEDGVYSSAPGAVLMASYWAQSVLPEKTIYKESKIKIYLQIPLRLMILLKNIM